MFTCIQEPLCNLLGINTDEILIYIESLYKNVSRRMNEVLRIYR